MTHGYVCSSVDLNGVESDPQQFNVDDLCGLLMRNQMTIFKDDIVSEIVLVYLFKRTNCDDVQRGESWAS